MTDKIVYTVNDTGNDGRATVKYVFASFDKAARDLWFASSKNKNYYTMHKHIIDTGEIERKALRKLDAVDRLVLKLSVAVIS